MERDALSHQCVNEETFTVGVKRLSRPRALIYNFKGRSSAMGNWDPEPINTEQLSLLTYNIDEIAAESGIAIDDLVQWNKHGWLSFFPQYGEEYQPCHLNGR